MIVIAAPLLGLLRSLKFGFHIIAVIAELIFQQSSDLSGPSEDQDNSIVSIEIHQMNDSTEILHQSTAIVLLFCNVMYI